MFRAVPPTCIDVYRPPLYHGSQGQQILQDVSCSSTIWRCHTKTLDIIKSLVLMGAQESRAGAMRDDVIALARIIRELLTNFGKVLERQGYTCLLTGIVDRRIPGPRPPNPGTLRCAHIFKRSVAVFPSVNSVSEL